VKSIYSKKLRTLATLFAIIFSSEIMLVSMALASSDSEGPNGSQSPTKATSYLEQFEQEQRKQNRAQQYQGRPQDSKEILNSARDRSSSSVNNCPKGTNRRKPEDVRQYLTQQDLFQKKIAESISKFTARALTKSEGIKDLNLLIQEHNALIIWGKGKVTDGACGSVSETEIIGKAYGTSKTLIQDYKRMVETNQ
jgi:hypothetical protein